MFQVYIVKKAEKIVAVGIAPGPIPKAASPGDTLEIIHAFDTQPAARAYQMQLLDHWKVSGSVHVLNEQTGVVYPTAYAAAQSIKASPANMSNHLKNKPGHRTIKGYTFRYVPAGYVGG